MTVELGVRRLGLIGTAWAAYLVTVKSYAWKFSSFTIRSTRLCCVTAKAVSEWPTTWKWTTIGHEY